MKTIFYLGKQNFMELQITEYKNNIKRTFIKNLNYENARLFLIKLYHSNKIIYCSDIKDLNLNYKESEELEFWQFRKIQKLIDSGFRFERKNNLK